jgi:hypothetical protein
MLGTVMPMWSTPRSPGSAGFSSDVVDSSSTFDSLRTCCDRSYTADMRLLVHRPGVPYISENSIHAHLGASLFHALG